MFDMHYDLLTITLMANKTKKDISHFLTPLNRENVKGVTANLYFMSIEEMKKELIYPHKINVLKMFKTAKKELEQYHLDCKFIYSIEGCDYIKDIKELEKLKKAGLNSILLVWNTESKYGSGKYSNKGLTEEGKKFIRKAIDLGLGIDLSHANEATFDGIIEEIKDAQNEGKSVICYASHSNIRSLHDHSRNLNDNQLEKLKEIGGLLGLVSYKDFLTTKDTKTAKEEYFKHIAYAVDKLGVDKVMVSSDNMDFNKFFVPEDNSAPAFYPYGQMNELIRQGLSSYFNEDTIEQIMFGNAHQLYKQLKNK